MVVGLVGFFSCFTPPTPIHIFVSNPWLDMFSFFLFSPLTLQRQVLGTNQRVMYMFNRLEVFYSLKSKKS